MKEHKLIDQNHQGGISGRSTTNTILEIYQKLVERKTNNLETALIDLDQSAAFDVISHELLELKLKHIGIHDISVKMIMNYLSERKQYVYLNANKSETLVTGNTSVSQGSIISGLLYLIFTLDMHMQDAYE